MTPDSLLTSHRIAPILFDMRWLLFVALTLTSATAWAQGEGADALSRPRGSTSAVTPTAPTTTDPAATTTPARPSPATATPSADAAAPTSDELPSVPPPPPTGYDPAVQYPAPAPAGVRGFVSDPLEGRIPSRIATRLRVLDGSLQALAIRGRNRLIDGILSLVAGGVMTGIGIWQWEANRNLASYLVLWGGSNLVRGIIDLVVTPNPTGPAIAYAHMPMTTPEQVRQRLDFGEAALERLARRTKIARVLDATINIGAGLAFIPLYLAPNDFRIVDPFDYFILIGSGISVLSGLISLLTRSDAERRWRAYRELRDRLEREAGTEGEVSWLLPEPEGVRFDGAGVAVVPQGAAFTLGGRF